MPLVLNSSSITGLAAVGGLSSPQTGSVLQVVTGVLNTNIATSSGTYVDSGLTATITPSSASSKVLVFVTGLGYKTAASTANGLDQNLVRNGTQIVEWNILSLYTATTLNLTGFYALNYLDSPASTSAQTYKVQFKNDTAGASVYMSLNNTPSVITLMEIAA